MMTTFETEHLKREFIRSDSEYLRRFATASVAHATDARIAATQVLARTTLLLKTLSETWRLEQPDTCDNEPLQRPGRVRK